MSKSKADSTNELSRLFQALSQPVRLNILLALGNGEACVCHLEALLGERQAYISQQLIFLKDAGIVDVRREGRNMYYHLINPEFLKIIHTAGDHIGQTVIEMKPQTPVPGCPCPKCNPGVKDCPPENPSF